MKKSGILFGMVLASAFFIMCGQQTKEENSNTKPIDAESEKAVEETDEPVSYESLIGQIDKEVLALTSNPADGKYWFTDGSYLGSNVSLRLDRGNQRCEFNVIGVTSKGKLTISDTYYIRSGQEGVVITLYQEKNAYGKTVPRFNVEIDEDLPTGGNVKSNDILLDAGERVDLKIVKGGPNTAGGVALIGADDARGAGYWEGYCLEAISKDLTTPIKVHISYRQSGNQRRLTFTSEEVAPEAPANKKCFWAYGQNGWGPEFNRLHNDCD